MNAEGLPLEEELGRLQDISYAGYQLRANHEIHSYAVLSITRNF